MKRRGAAKASTFSGRVRVAREAKGKTLDQLARECGFASRQNLLDWLQRPAREIELERYTQLSHALGVSLAWLATGEEK